MKSLLSMTLDHDIEILNGIHVKNLQNSNNAVLVHTNHGIIKASYCLVATNGFAKVLFPELDIKPARAQVLITESIDHLPFRGTYHLDQGYYYFREIDNRVLFGGGRHLDLETECTSETELNDKIQEKLTKILQDTILPNTPHKIAHRWTGIMGVGEHKKPIIQQTDSRIVCAIKLGGMGIAIGTKTGFDGAKLISRIATSIGV